MLTNTTLFGSDCPTRLVSIDLDTGVDVPARGGKSKPSGKTRPWTPPKLEKTTFLSRKARSEGLGRGCFAAQAGCFRKGDPPELEKTTGPCPVAAIFDSPIVIEFDIYKLYIYY